MNIQYFSYASLSESNKNAIIANEMSISVVASQNTRNAVDMANVLIRIFWFCLIAINWYFFPPVILSVSLKFNLIIYALNDMSKGLI